MGGSAIPDHEVMHNLKNADVTSTVSSTGGCFLSGCLKTLADSAKIRSASAWLAVEKGALGWLPGFGKIVKVSLL